MINCKQFYDALRREGVGFFSGVPDSLLKDFCAFLGDHTEAHEHVIAANEGCAVGLAAGHYLAMGGVPLVYMQNSGQGNALNPLLSLCDPEVCGIPMLLLVGWRGEPGQADESQHVVQGKVTQALFQAVGIPCSILPDDFGAAEDVLRDCLLKTVETNRPVALLVRKGTFSPYTLQKKPVSPYTLSREEAIEAVVDHLPSDAAVVATTGKAARELYELRKRTSGEHSKDFLCIGAMGHASQIALGIALAKPEQTVCCLDGDGAALMHLGGLPIVASSNAVNYKHILLNNGVHDSVGGQPTVGFSVDFCAMAKASGYARTFRAESHEQLSEVLKSFIEGKAPAFLEIRIASGSRKDLGRPKISPMQNKRTFMDFMNGK